MRKKDVAVISIAMFCALALYMCGMLLQGGKASSVVVTINGEEALRVPLSIDKTFTFEQQDGAVNVLEVHDGAARMVEANCRDGLCIKQGETSSAAKSIVCLPHGLVVRLEGGVAEPLDKEIDVII